MAWYEGLVIFDENEPGLNHFIWTDGAGNVHDDLLTLPYPDVGMFVVADSEQGHRRPEQEDYIEPTPDYLSDQYRAPVYKPRLYSYEVLIAGTTRGQFEQLQGRWDSWHSAELGQGIYKRETARGLIRCLDCVPRPPGEMTGIALYAKTFRQAYLAANPWWRTENMNEVMEYFDAANEITFYYTNSGEIPAWPYILITGKVSNPKVRTQSDEIEVLYTTIDNDDEIRIDCRPNTLMRRSAFYYRHGTGSPVAVSLSSASKYVQLPRGISPLRISAAAGNAQCIVSAYDYYGSLYTEVAI